jgi:hypothetical protein
VTDIDPGYILRTYCAAEFEYAPFKIPVAYFKVNDFGDYILDSLFHRLSFFPDGFKAAMFLGSLIAMPSPAMRVENFLLPRLAFGCSFIFG